MSNVRRITEGDCGLIRCRGLQTGVDAGRKRRPFRCGERLALELQRGDPHVIRRGDHPGYGTRMYTLRDARPMPAAPIRSLTGEAPSFDTGNSRRNTGPKSPLASSATPKKVRSPHANVVDALVILQAATQVDQVIQDRGVRILCFTGQVAAEQADVPMYSIFLV